MTTRTTWPGLLAAAVLLGTGCGVTSERPAAESSVDVVEVAEAADTLMADEPGQEWLRSAGEEVLARFAAVGGERSSKVASVRLVSRFPTGAEIFSIGNRGTPNAALRDRLALAVGGQLTEPTQVHRHLEIRAIEPIDGGWRILFGVWDHVADFVTGGFYQAKVGDDIGLVVVGETLFSDTHPSGGAEVDASPFPQLATPWSSDEKSHWQTGFEKQ